VATGTAPVMKPLQTSRKLRRSSWWAGCGAGAVVRAGSRAGRL